MERPGPFPGPSGAGMGREAAKKSFDRLGDKVLSRLPRRVGGWTTTPVAPIVGDRGVGFGPVWGRAAVRTDQNRAQPARALGLGPVR